MNFDPFGKPLSDLETPDLESLRAVSEGWYVEYKREPIDASKTGKAICAFANHQGGWLVIGVEAPDRLPKSFPGLDGQELSRAMSAVRDGARAHMSPAAQFDSKELHGPNDVLGLQAGRSVLVIRIPQGHNPPYIHSSGKIYRRLADASDPRAETDRAVLDLLVERGNKFRKSFRKRVKRFPEFSKDEKELPCLQMFLTNDPWCEQDPKYLLKHEDFARVVGSSEGVYTLPLEVTFPTAYGFCGRQIGTNDPYSLSLTWFTSFNGFSEMVVPLRALTFDNSAPYKYSRDFLQMLPPSLAGRSIDATLLWIFVAHALRLQARIANVVALTGNIQVKFRFLNIWRRVPFIDTQSYLTHIKEHGVPVIQRSQAEFPAGNNPNDLLEIAPWEGEGTNTEISPLLQASSTSAWALRALGVDKNVLTDATTLIEINEMFGRAARAHAMR